MDFISEIERHHRTAENGFSSAKPQILKHPCEMESLGERMKMNLVSTVMGILHFPRRKLPVIIKREGRS